MGLILDSSTVVAAERRRDTVEQLLEQVVSATGDQEGALSSIGLTELIHGISRANTPEHLRRQAFIDELLRVLVVYPYTRETGLLSRKNRWRTQAKGITIPFGDLLIGATALVLDFSNSHSEHPPFPSYSRH